MTILIIINDFFIIVSGCVNECNNNVWVKIILLWKQSLEWETLVHLGHFWQILADKLTSEIFLHVFSIWSNRLLVINNLFGILLVYVNISFNKYSYFNYIVLDIAFSYPLGSIGTNGHVYHSLSCFEWSLVIIYLHLIQAKLRLILLLSFVFELWIVSAFKINIFSIERDFILNSSWYSILLLPGEI